MPLLLILDSLLHDALQTIKKPLEYSAKNEFANIERVRDLEKTVSTWVDRLITSELSPAQQHELRDREARGS